LRPTLAAVTELVRDRLVQFEGAHNVRDLGGYPTVDGGTTRWGVLYRAGLLSEMTAADLDAFDALCVRTVFDLRRDDERAVAPDPMPNVHVCLMSHVLANTAMPDRSSLVDDADGREFMRRLYSGLLAHCGPEIGRLIRGLVEPGALPALFHCTAGKDRTGIVAALILLAVGVDRETVLDDFELTNSYITRDTHAAMYQRMLDHGMSPEAAAGMFAADRASMAATLDELDTTYAGAETYLSTSAGLTSDDLDRLRAALLD
jgi:protein-tyrosine phosphatase